MEICMLIKYIVLSITIQKNLHYVYSCKMDGKNIFGYIMPKSEIVLEYNKDPLELYCTLNEKMFKIEDFPSKDMYFVQEKVNMTENVEIINSTTIRLRVENPKISSNTYYCKHNRRTICLTHVIVGEKPSTEINFKCESYNLQSLSCEWLPQNNTIKTSLQINFTLSYGKNILECYKDETRNRCNVNPLDYHPTERYYNFRIIARNILGEAITNVTFDNFKNVRSAPPINLTVIGFNENSIKIRWKNPPHMYIIPLKYRIFYKCNFGIEDWKLVFYNISYMINTIEYNLTNLYPNQNCIILVSLMSNYSDGNMWSKNSSISCKTKSIVPGGPPKVNTGSFNIEKVSENVNNVYIYWQQIPKEMENGNNFHYNVKILHSPSNYNRTKKVSNYVKFDHLYNNQSYEVSIWSENSEGISINKSFLTIPAQTQRMSEPEYRTVMSYKNGTFELKFRPPKKTIAIKTYTFFWCKSLKPPRCNGFLNWTEIPSNLTSFIVPFRETTGTSWQFGVSANSNNVTSGISWVSCTLQEGKEIIEDFKVIKVNSTSITLRWQCKCHSEFLNMGNKYFVSYCPVNQILEDRCKDDKDLQNKRIFGSTIFIQNLHPNTFYKLMLNVVSKDSMVTWKLLHKTDEGAPSKPFVPKVILVTNSSINITWSPPLFLNGILSYYRLRINNEMFNESILQTLQHTFKNLSSHYNYTISVAACTKLCSEFSENITILTKTGVPGVVYKLRILSQKESVIIIDWNKPDIVRGKIDYYEVKVGENNDFSIINVTSSNYSRKCDLNSFYVSVRAVNVDGDKLYPGPWSTELECFCVISLSTHIIVIVIFVIVGIIIVFFLIWRLYKNCSLLKAEDIILPGNLKPPVWDLSKNLENLEDFRPIFEDKNDKSKTSLLTTNNASKLGSKRSSSNDKINIPHPEQASSSELSILCPRPIPGDEIRDFCNDSTNINETNSLCSQTEINDDNCKACPDELTNSSPQYVSRNLPHYSYYGESEKKYPEILEPNEKSKDESPYLMVSEISTQIQKNTKTGSYVMVGKSYT